MNNNILYLITIEDFKAYFQREFDYITNHYWLEDKTYKKDCIVYYEENNLFYISLQDNNKGNIPSEVTEWWQETEGNIYDYITDNDIEKAFGQARTSFNIDLFINNKETLKIAYLLLTAHYLVMDLNMSNGSGASNFLITSKSVDGVSASYGIPQKYLNNPYLAYLAGSSFGLKYLQYLVPLMIGNIKVIGGATFFI